MAPDLADEDDVQHVIELSKELHDWLTEKEDRATVLGAVMGMSLASLYHRAEHKDLVLSNFSECFQSLLSHLEDDENLIN